MSEEPRSGWHVSPQAVFGIAIVLFGLLLTAQNMGIVTNVTRFIRFWPMVFTAAGLAIVLDRDATGSRRLFGALLVFGGLWQTANTAFRLNWYIDEWWPLFLIGFGVFLIMRTVQRSSEPGSASQATGSMGEMGSMGAAGATAAPPRQDSREDVVTSFALMSGVKRKIFSPGFRRANLTAIMGGVEFDLRQCAATGGESIIDVFAIWGGIEIRIPADWQVVSDVTPIMGGVDDRSGHLQPLRHRLVIKGLAIMGGVEVKS